MFISLPNEIIQYTSQYFDYFTLLNTKQVCNNLNKQLIINYNYFNTKSNIIKSECIRFAIKLQYGMYTYNSLKCCLMCKTSSNDIFKYQVNLIEHIRDNLILNTYYSVYCNNCINSNQLQLYYVSNSIHTTLSVVKSQYILS
jgi:hypothetical protein